MSLSDIAFAQIKDNYYWGQYSDFKVIVDISTGYINATYLCKLGKLDHGKSRKFNHWTSNENSQIIIDELISLTGYPVDDLLRIITGGQVLEIRGTYAHPDLIPHIASWASPKFAVKVSKIVNACIVRDYKESLRIKDQTIDRLEQTINEIKQQNIEQSMKMDEQMRQNNEQLELIKAMREENSHVLDQLDTITNELEDASIDNEHLSTQMNAIAVKLDIATDQRVPPAKREICNEVFAIYRNLTTTKFYMIRRQKRTIKAGIDNCVRNGFTERIFYSDSPNAVNLGVRIKDTLPRTLGTISGTIITLANGKSVRDIIEYVSEAETEKKNI